MSNLGIPSINVTFTEKGVSAVGRGDKGTVALILRQSAAFAPFAVTQASDIPEGLTAENLAYTQRAFTGYINPPKKVLAFGIGAAGGEDEPGVTLNNALAWMAAQDFDYLCGPADCTAAEAETIASWVKSQRTEPGVKFKAVLPNTAADSYAVVNFTGAGMTDGTVTFTTAQYCSRIAGLLAGTPMNISATYAPLLELTGVDAMTREEQAAAVNAGKLIVIHDGRKAKLSRAVNSFVTTAEGMLDSFKKIKLVEVMDLIRCDITQTAEDDYIGKYANSYDNKLLLVTAIRGYLDGLRADGLIRDGFTVEIDTEQQRIYLESRGVDVSEMSEQEIKEADTGSRVFLLVKCKLLDAIEDIDIGIEI